MNPTTPRTDPERRIDGAREEAERRWTNGHMHSTAGAFDLGQRKGFVAGATWADQQHEATTRALLSDLHDARTRAMEAEGEVARLETGIEAVLGKWTRGDDQSWVQDLGALIYTPTEAAEIERYQRAMNTYSARASRVAREARP